MNYDLKKPCEGCPFRRNAAPGWLGDYKAEEIVQMARRGENFLCHVHVEKNRGYGDDIPLNRLDELEDDDGGPVDADDELPFEIWADVYGQQCAGFMIFMRKLCKLPSNPAYAKASRAIDTEQDILFPPDVFVDHHVNGFDRMIAKRKGKTK